MSSLVWHRLSCQEEPVDFRSEAPWWVVAMWIALAESLCVRIRKWGSDASVNWRLMTTLPMPWVVACRLPLSRVWFLMEKLYALHECQPVVTEGGVYLLRGDL